jgi:hypothetical protein
LAVSQKYLFVVLMLVSIIFLILTFIIVNQPAVDTVLGFLVLFFDLLAFATKFYTPFFVPFLQMKNRTVTMDSEEPFVMAPSGNAIVIRKEGDVYASTFIKIPTYRSATEMSPEEKIDFSKLFARALTLSKKPVRFGSQLYVINKDTYISHIVNKLNEAEERYQNMSVSKNVSKAESERVRGEVTMWHNLFESVNKVKSQALEAFAMTTAYGGNEEEAINLALQQAVELAVGVSSLFGVTATLLEGEELLKFIEPDYMIPLVTVSEQIRQRTISEGV